MQEIIPLAFGAVIGVAVQWVRGPRLRAVALVILCLIFGALASFINGELVEPEVGLGFISVDTVLVFVGALVAVGAAALWRRRAAATR
jgi:uncharacterized membrane protein YeaQ/YmgE (transglycosylase-associated protein family)